MTWFEEWFNEHYLDLYASRRNEKDAIKQIHLILKKINPTKTQAILDVGCGIGRHVKSFSDLGYSITGIDLSKSLITIGKKQFPDLNLINCSLEDLIKKNNKFDLIVSLFTSFGYYEREEDNLKMLQQMTQLLHQNGTLWMDFLNAEAVRKQPLKDSIIKITKPDGIKYFFEKRRINQNSGLIRIEKEITLETENKKKNFKESVRLYSHQELKDMFFNCRLKVREVFGNYEGQPLSASSPRMILWGKKN